MPSLRNRWARLSTVVSAAKEEAARREAEEMALEVRAALGNAAPAAVGIASTGQSMIAQPQWMIQQAATAAAFAADGGRRRTGGGSKGGGAGRKGAGRAASASASRTPGRGSKRGPDDAFMGAPAAGSCSGIGVVDLRSGPSPLAKKRSGTSVASAGGASHSATAAAGSEIRPDVEHFFDFEKILLGDTKGQSIAGAGRTLKSLTGAHQIKQKQQLKSELPIAEMALKCSPTKIAELDFPTLQGFLRVIGQHAKLPLITKAVYCRLHLDQLMSMQEAKNVFQVMRPWSSPDEVLTVFAFPTLRELLVIWAGDHGSDEALIPILSSILTEGFFGNGLCGMIEGGGDGTEAKDTTADVLKFCSVVLEENAKAEAFLDHSTVPDFYR